MAIGSATKIGIGYLLLGIPGVAALGAPIGTVACYLFALAFSLASLSKTIGYTFSFWDLIGKPSLASLAGIGTATFVYQELFFGWGRFLGIFAAILLSVLLYGLCAAALGVFSFADFQPILSAIKRKRSTVREVWWFLLAKFGYNAQKMALQNNSIWRKCAILFHFFAKITCKPIKAYAIL